MGMSTQASFKSYVVSNPTMSQKQLHGGQRTSFAPGRHSPSHDPFQSLDCQLPTEAITRGRQGHGGVATEGEGEPPILHSPSGQGKRTQHPHPTKRRRRAEPVVLPRRPLSQPG